MFAICGFLARLANCGCPPSVRCLSARCEGSPSPGPQKICSWVCRRLTLRAALSPDSWLGYESPTRFSSGTGDQRGFRAAKASRNLRMSTIDGSLEVSSKMEKETFYFGSYKIDASEVFVVTPHSYAFVNLRPVVPDTKHVLVASRRLVPRFLDLTSEEASDLWLTAKRIGQKLEPFFKASSLTFAIQDGPQAGQTVPHVHVHILPRKGGDFKNNDEVYDVMDDKEKELAEHLDLDQDRKDRTFAEMAVEATKLRALF